MSLPRFRVVQGKALGERSTPPAGVSTPEPLIPPNAIKQENVSFESVPMSSEVHSSIKLEEPMSPPEASSQQPGSIQRPMQYQSPSPMQQSQPPNPQQPPPNLQQQQSGEDRNVVKCVRFLKTLISLSNNEDPEMPDKAQRVKDLIQGVIYMDHSAEDFTTALQQVLKSQAQPHLLPFLRNTLPALRNAVRNGGTSVEGVSPPPGYVFSNGRRAMPAPLQQPDLRGMPSNGHHGNPPQQIINRLNAEPPIQPRQIGRGPVHGPMVGQQVQMGHQNMAMNQQPMHIQHGPPPMQQPPQHVTPVPQPQHEMKMEVEETPRTRHYPEGSLKSSILKPDEVLNRITKRMMSPCSVEEEALIAISDAVESHLRELITQMGNIAEHRVESMRVPENYEAIDDVKRQLRFLEELDRQEEELRESREKESLIRMSKNKNSGKETIEKAKEMQRQDAEAKRNRDANAAAIAALSSNRTVKNKWEGSSSTNTAPRPRTVRVTTRDLHLLVNQDSRFTGTFIREKLSYGGPTIDTSI